MQRSPRKTLTLVVFLLAVSGDVGLSIWASAKATYVDTVTALQTDGREVHVAVDDRIYTADVDGNAVNEFVDRDGTPWHGSFVSSISEEPTGSFLVSELGKPDVSEFDADGHLERRIPLPFVPVGRTAVAALDDYIWVSDTQSDQVAVVDRNGRLHSRRRVRYANAANVVDTADGGSAVVFANTRETRVEALDAEMKPASVPLVDEINRLRSGRQGIWKHFRSILWVWMPSDASRALLTLTRDTTADGTFVSVTKDGVVRILGDTGAILPAKSLDPDDLMGMEAAEPVPGLVLVPSQRASTVLSFTTTDASASPFCTSCLDGSFAADARPLADARMGFTWPNGTRVGVFGDQQIRNIYDDVRAKRAYYRSLASGSRTALYVLVALLLVAFVVSGQTATDTTEELPSRLGIVLSRLILPSAGPLVAALWFVMATAAAGGLAGYLVSGNGGAIIGSGLLAWTASRFWITPWLVRHQPPERAHAAFEVFYGHGAPREIPMLPAEVVEYASFAVPQRRGFEKFSGIAASALEDDLWDAISAVIPRTVLIVRTNQRLLVVKCNSWGAPVADPALLRIESTDVALPGLLVTRQGNGVAAFDLGGRSSRGETLTTEPPQYLCRICGQHVGSCKHRPPTLAAALAWSALLPGLGQLMQRRFGSGRFLAGMAVLSIVGIVHGALPQIEHTLLFDPSAWMGAVAAYVGVWLAAQFELVQADKLAERRSRVARGI